MALILEKAPVVTVAVAINAIIMNAAYLWLIWNVVRDLPLSMSGQVDNPKNEIKDHEKQKILAFEAARENLDQLNFIKSLRSSLHITTGSIMIQ